MLYKIHLLPIPQVGVMEGEVIDSLFQADKLELTDSEKMG